MAKQIINIGTADQGNGDPLRTAFVKVNENFTELYEALGLDIGNLNLGAFEFTGSTITTTDSSNITIDQAVVMTSELEVGGDIVPNAANQHTLGTPTKPFKSLYVSNSTVYLGGTPLSLDPNTNELKINNVPISQNITYTDIPNAPTDVSDLTDNTGLLGGGGASTGDITFAATTLTAPNDDEIFIAAKTAERDRAKLRLNPVDGDAYLEVWSFEGTRSDSSWATGVWELNIYGNPTIQFTGAFDLADWVVGTLQSGVDPDTVSYSINGGPYIQWNGGSSADPVTGSVDISTGTAPPANPTTITSIDWKYTYKSRIGTSYGNQKVEIDTQGQDLDINIDGSVQLYSTGTMNISNSNSSNSSDINIYSGDDILIQGKNKTTSDSEGGDINIRAGKGGDADSNDSAGGGGDIDIRAGAGGDFSPLYNPGFGGTATLRAGDGGIGSVTYNKIARPGGTLSLYAGSAGYNDGNPSLGSYGANVTIQAGNSNSQSDNGGSIILSPGTNGFGSSTLAGNVEISIPSSSGSNGGSWIFGGDGRTLTIPGDIRSEQEINIDINLSDSTLRRWRFGEDGNLTLPGGGNINGADYDVEIAAGDNGVSTYGHVTLKTNGPNGVNEFYMNSLGELNLPRGGVIQEDTVTNEYWGGTTTALTLVPGGAANGTQRLEIYSTAGGEGDHIHITSGDQNQTDLFLGNDTQYFAVGAMGQMEIRARKGLDSPSPGTGAESGSNVNIYAGDAGDNGGNTVDGNSGGDVYIASGISTSGLGGDILLNTSSGPDGFGSIELSTDGGSSYWTFNKDNQIVFPDSTVQTTAYTGTANLATVARNIENEGDVSIRVNLTDSTTHTWRFGEDGNLNLAGNLQFPNGAEIRDVNGDLRLRAAPGDAAQLQGLTTDGAVDAAVKAFHDIETGSYVTINTNIDAGAPEHVWTFDYNGDLTFPDTTVQTTAFTTSPTLNVLKIEDGVHEKFQTKSNATGTVTHDCSSGHIFYHTLPSANWTVNLTNLNLAVGYATTVTLVIEQGATGYYPNAVQIDGNGVGLAWQGNTTPTPSSSRTDVVTFSILYDGLYTVLGQLTGF